MEDTAYELAPISVNPTDLVTAELAEEKPEYWGFWATIGFSVLITVVYLIANTMIVVLFMATSGLFNTGINPQGNIEALEYNGLLLSVSTILSTPFVIAPGLLFIYLRRGVSIRQYLALCPVSSRTLLGWLAITTLFLFSEDVLLRFTDDTTANEFMKAIWESAGCLPLLWLTLVVFAPLGEEFFFRGFLFVGLQRSRLGNIGAVLLTSALWAAIHTQYNTLGIGIIFVLGILLGIARIRTRSLFVPLAMHGLINAMAAVQTALLQGSWV